MKLGIELKCSIGKKKDFVRHSDLGGEEVTDRMFCMECFTLLS